MFTISARAQACKILSINESTPACIRKRLIPTTLRLPGPELHGQSPPPFLLALPLQSLPASQFWSVSTLPCPVPHEGKKNRAFSSLTHKIALWTRYHAKVNLLVFCTTKKEKATAGKVTYTLRRGFNLFLHIGIHMISSTKSYITDCRYEPAMKKKNMQVWSLKHLVPFSHSPILFRPR